MDELEQQGTTEQATTDVVEQPDTTAVEASTDAGQGEQQQVEDTGDELAGLSRDEVNALLTKAAKFDDLEQQLRRVNGKFGELNSRISQWEAKQPNAMQQFEADNPDLAAYVKASVPQGQQYDPGDVDTRVQLAAMDALRKGWREEIATRDFSLWLATQSDEVGETFRTTSNAAELHGVLGKFDAWKAAKSARQNSSRQRLEQNMTPSGSAGKVKAEMTEQDAFRAAFNARIKKG